MPPLVRCYECLHRQFCTGLYYALVRCPASQRAAGVPTDLRTALESSLRAGNSFRKTSIHKAQLDKFTSAEPQIRESREGVPWRPCRMSVPRSRRMCITKITIAFGHRDEVFSASDSRFRVRPFRAPGDCRTCFADQQVYQRHCRLMQTVNYCRRRQPWLLRVQAPDDLPAWSPHQDIQDLFQDLLLLRWWMAFVASGTEPHPPISAVVFKKASSHLCPDASPCSSGSAKPCDIVTIPICGRFRHHPRAKTVQHDAERCNYWRVLGLAEQLRPEPPEALTGTVADSTQRQP